jgi:hypothetical protein
VTRQLALLRVAIAGEEEFVRITEETLAAIEQDIIQGRTATIDSLRARFEETTRAAITEYAAALNAGELAQVQAEWTAGALNAALGIDVATIAQSVAALLRAPDEIVIAGSPIREWFETYTDDLTKDIMRQVRLGIANGENMREIATRIGGGRDVPGLLEIKRTSARTMARTLTMGVSTEAMMATYRDNLDIINGWIHTSTLDSRTTPTCAVRDGLAWDKEFQPVNHNQIFQNPPLHPNCRSLMLPWLGSAEDMPDAIREQLSATTRASLDGQVPASKTFAEWLEGKPEEFQRKWFGAGRYELFKAGKITFSDLVRADGKPLTLADLTNPNNRP